MGDIRREDIEGEEAWAHVTDEPDIRLVEATKDEHRLSGGDWVLSVAVMEFVRIGDPPYAELVQAIEAAALNVPGVSGIQRQDTEVWLVDGSPSGEQLTRTVAEVIDARADALRAWYGRPIQPPRARERDDMDAWSPTPQQDEEARTLMEDFQRATTTEAQVEALRRLTEELEAQKQRHRDDP